jgi:hypothetical protein
MRMALSASAARFVPFPVVQTAMFQERGNLSRQNSTLMVNAWLTARQKLPGGSTGWAGRRLARSRNIFFINDLRDRADTRQVARGSQGSA